MESDFSISSSIIHGQLNEGSSESVGDDGQGLNLGIINQYGQLVGEYSRLDDELWFSKNEDDDAVPWYNEGLMGNFQSSYKEDVQLQCISNCVKHSFVDGGTTVVNSISSSSKGFSLHTFRSNGIWKSLAVKRPRSKRPRPPTFNLRQALLIMLPTPSIMQRRKPNQSTDINHIPKSRRPKTAKKCLHCEVTETPQWRPGPMGPGTLCNACGIQYRQGRLFPEYLPAKSPIYVPSLHSSFPKKLLQLRSEFSTRYSAISGYNGRDIDAYE